MVKLKNFKLSGHKNEKGAGIVLRASRLLALAAPWLMLIMIACGGCGGGGGGGDSVVAQYSRNGMPSVSGLKIGQTEENILISFSVSDPESDMCMVKVYYSADRGANYVQITNIEIGRAHV